MQIPAFLQGYQPVAPETLDVFEGKWMNG